MGPARLLERLELELGLAGEIVSPIERVVALSSCLGPGYWDVSYTADPISTARRLLEDRDMLAMWGWRGEPASERLAQLWAATEAAFPGIPERLLRVVDTLSRISSELTTITLFESVDAFPPLWQRVFDALARTGVQVRTTVRPLFRGQADLGAARDESFSPQGDRTLQLFRPYGALTGATEVAAAIAAVLGDRELLVIGADSVLDASLVRHGIPRLGADIPSPGSTSLVRLVIEAAFHPMDISDLYALICADPGPIPRGVAWGLTTALRTHAARDSEVWRERWTEAMAAIDEPVRAPLQDRITTLLSPAAARDRPLALDELTARMSTLSAWARGRASRDASMNEVALRAEMLVKLAMWSRRNELSRLQLLALCEELEQPFVTGTPAQAGLHSIATPGAMLAPARAVVWWGFTRDRAPRHTRLRLSQAERGRLAELGVAAPEPAVMMEREARAWRRPLELAVDELILVCPRTDAVGDPAHPHPLWDEITGRMPDRAMQARLEVDYVSFAGTGAVRTSVAMRPVPQAFERARAPGSITLRTEESPSSLEQLLECPLAYTLQYVARLRARLSARPLVPGPQMFGNLAHWLLANIFDGSASLTPSEAASRAETLFDEALPRLSETLLLDELSAERAVVRRAIAGAAALVAEICATTGSRIRGLEVPLNGQIENVRVSGVSDLVLESPAHVVDFKWGSARQRERLRAGTAAQLAIYAALAQEPQGSSWPGTAFLALRDQRLFAARGTGISGAIEPGLATTAEMLAGVVGAVGRRREQLERGDLAVPGVGNDVVKSRLADGVMELSPGCEFCDQEGLCGRRGRA